MSKVYFENIEHNRWYKISLYADKCKAYGRTIEWFEAKFDGQWWIDINNVKYSVYSVYGIDDDLAF